MLKCRSRGFVPLNVLRYAGFNNSVFCSIGHSMNFYLDISSCQTFAKKNNAKNGEYSQAGKILRKEKISDFSGSAKFTHGVSDRWGCLVSWHLHPLSLNRVILILKDKKVSQL